MSYTNDVPPTLYKHMDENGNPYLTDSKDIEIKGLLYYENYITIHDFFS